MSETPKEKPSMPLLRASTLALPKTRAEKVAHCAALMRNLQWETGKTGVELAEEWGMAVTSLRDIAGEASRMVRAEVTDPDRVIGTGLIKLERMIDDSMTDAKSQPDIAHQHRKVAIDGINKLLTLTGAAAPQKVEMTMERLSDEEVDKRLTELAKRVAEATRGRETVMGEVGEGETEENE